MKRLTKEDIDKYLSEISERLGLEKKYGYMILAGGSAMTMIYNTRNTTHDIDALYKPKKAFRRVIKNIADENDLNNDWLNDGIKGFLSKDMTASVYREYPNLSVRILDAECLLAMKLTSARAFSKDMSDSIILMKHLGIENEKQLFDLIEKYIPKPDQIARAYYFTKEAFTQYSNQRKKTLGEQIIQSLEHRMKSSTKENEKKLFFNDTPSFSFDR